MSISIGCGQINIIPGRPDLNTYNILRCINAAKQQNLDILILPELAVPGYLIGDLWEQPSFLKDCEHYGKEILKATKDICVIFGNIALDKAKLNEDGHIRKYNAAFVAYNKKFITAPTGYNFFIKNSMPDYREFDDNRYFYSLRKHCLAINIDIEDALKPLRLNIKGQDIDLGIFICEDGWTDNYAINVPKTLCKNGAKLLINISCSPFTLGKNQKRDKVFKKHARTFDCPIIYCNNIGTQNNGKNIFIYDGSSSFYEAGGKKSFHLPMYEEGLAIVNYNPNNNKFSDYLFMTQAGKKIVTDSIYENEIKTIHDSLCFGIKHFLKQCNIKKMVVGISGGIDSALTAALFSEILGPKNVLLVNMPSKYNSSTTKALAEELARNLKTNYGVVPIQKSVEHTIHQLNSTEFISYTTANPFHLHTTSYVEENIQARDRGARLLAALAAAFKGGFSCNANKAEITVGYATFYGDICGVIAPIADLWKHQVYDLARYMNEHIYHEKVFPDKLFTIRPSAELSAAQTVGSGGDPIIYEYHDYLFKTFVENWNKTSPDDILEHYSKNTLEDFLQCEKGLVKKLFPTPKAFIDDLEKWFTLFSGFAVAKRIQAPPIITISRRAYGYDHRESQLSPYFSCKYFKIKEDLLK